MYHRAFKLTGQKVQGLWIEGVQLQHLPQQPTGISCIIIMLFHAK
jgi:hypothetical protein